MKSRSSLSQFIKAEALRLGFTVCGIAKAAPVEQQTTAFIEDWTKKGHHGTMSYLERNREKRYDPTLLVPNCKSIICVALNYYTDGTDESKLHISRYAQGNDYHKIVKEKLFALMKAINRIEPINGRAFCDTAPLLERYWATRAGIGWIGKNHQLIIPNAGTHFFLGEILLDIELEYDTPTEGERCGNCDKCLTACPTKALSAKGFDARRCLSYLTIEYRDELSKNIGEMMGNCFYGCDRCQACCPHNRFATETAVEELKAKEGLQKMRSEDWYNLSIEKYNELFADSAVERCGYEQLKRNIEAIKK
jgi:epoxyqueuosine reductase